MKPTNQPTKDVLFVSIQLILFTTYLFRIPELGEKIPSWLQYTGLLLAALGVILSQASVIALRNSLSVFPTPKYSAELIQIGHLQMHTSTNLYRNFTVHIWLFHLFYEWISLANFLVIANLSLKLPTRKSYYN